MKKTVNEIVLRINKLTTKPVQNQRLINKWKRILKNHEKVLFTVTVEE